tara:strand:+ start:970 stop:1488 length:519 start_codon:yes stop_codon:yes gene_type:complete
MKYDILILPPDTHQFTIRDRLTDEKLFFNQIINYVSDWNKNLNIVIKYRTIEHRRKFPTDLDNIVGYANLISICKNNSLVIGPVNSATIECLKKKIKYFCYRYDPDLFNNLSHTYTLDKMLYVSKNINEFKKNFENINIFREGYNTISLTHKDGIKLNLIVNKILDFKNEDR